MEGKRPALDQFLKCESHAPSNQISCPSNGLAPGAKQLDFLEIEIDAYEDGDVFTVELRQGVPAEETGDYREFAAPGDRTPRPRLGRGSSRSPRTQGQVAKALVSAVAEAARSRGLE